MKLKCTYCVLFIVVQLIVLFAFGMDSGGPLIPEQAAYDVVFYDIQMTINPHYQTIIGIVIVEAICLDTLDVFVIDLNVNFDVQVVTWEGEEEKGSTLGFEYRSTGSSEGKYWIDLPFRILPGDEIKIKIAYSGKPDFFWSQSEDGRPWIGVECEYEGGDKWWPCKDHPSDEPDSVSLHFRIPATLTCVSNGILRGVEVHGDDTKTFHWFSSNPINNYNITFYLGNYQIIEHTYESIAGETFPMNFWVLPESYTAASSHSSQFLDHMSFLEFIYGPYPFRAEKYGVAEAMSSMEHQTIIAYAYGFKNGSCGFDWLHLHELSHEWWGNMVTAKDWSDVWIHESFATYTEALYAEHLGGKDDYQAYIASKADWVNIYPIAPRESITMQTAWQTVDIYYKGAWVLHTLRYYLGDELFFTLLRRWLYPDPELQFVTDGGQCRLATTDEFLDIAELVTGQELDWFFETYLRQATLPRLRAELVDNLLSLTWEIENNNAFRIPVEIQIGDSLYMVDMENGSGQIRVSEGEVPVIDPDQWILMYPVIIEGFPVDAWMPQFTGTTSKLYELSRFVGDTCWMVGSHGVILKTTDCGDTWIHQNSGVIDWFSSVDFSNANTGWVASILGNILKTTNGGNLWEVQHNVDTIWLNDVDFVDHLNGWVVGDLGTIVHTTDGGENWISQTSGTTMRLYGVQFINRQIGWAVGSSGTILKTTNGGQTWSSLDCGTTNTFLSLYFINENTGWIVGIGSSVYKTTNGGTNWVSQHAATHKTFWDVKFVNESLGWVVGSEGSIRKTTNGGIEWSTQTSGTENSLYTVSFRSSFVGVTAGENGILLKTIDSGETDIGGGEYPTSHSPEELGLMQNYPNPFNASTSFVFSLPKPSKTTFKIFNVLGEEVETIVQEWLSAGKHRISWIAQNQPSGIYFYRLESGEQVKTRKLVLIK